MKTPTVAAAYALVALFLFLCAMKKNAEQAEEEEVDPVMVPAE